MIEEIKRVTNLRRNYPHLQAITLSTDIAKFFEDYLDFAESVENKSEFIEAWIIDVKERTLNGIDLNFDAIQDR